MLGQPGQSGSSLFPNHSYCECQCEGECLHLCCFEGYCNNPSTCQTEDCNQREVYRRAMSEIPAQAPQQGPSDVKALADAITTALAGLSGAKASKASDGKRIKNLLGKAVAPAQHVEEIDHTSTLKKCIMFLYEVKRSVIDVDPNDVKSWVNAFDVVRCKMLRHSALADEVRAMAAASGAFTTVHEAEDKWKVLVRKVLQSSVGSTSITDDSVVRDSYQDAYVLKDDESPAALYARVKTGVVAARWARYWIGGTNPLAAGMSAAMDEEVKERFKDALPSEWRPSVSLGKAAAEYVAVATEFHKNSPVKPAKKHKSDKPAPACTIDQGPSASSSSSSTSSSSMAPPIPQADHIMAAIASMTSALGSSFSAQMGNVTRSIDALRSDAPPSYPAQQQHQAPQWNDHQPQQQQQAPQWNDRQPRSDQGGDRSRNGRGRGRGRGK